MPDQGHTETLRAEFRRASKTFADRTRGRFDDLGVVEFGELEGGETVLEVGGGTGNFLGLFDGIAARLIAVDLTPEMLRSARDMWPHMDLVAADGARLPIAARSVQLAASALTLHHIWEPLGVLREMRRVITDDGKVLIVDQIAPERHEQVIAMDRLERLRDPSHASSRPRSALQILLRAAGFRILKERTVEGEQRLSGWMWLDEFPQERIDKVRRFIDEHGAETGMDFRRDGDDYVFRRRRIMMLAGTAGGKD